ncbi:MAG TPA: hypothetical protein VHM26_03800 [Chitinophagaceae bacterium]|jgi:hypothetical protein|nr:hypothetical protein [Chitinophagaceae bacterium]
MAYAFDFYIDKLTESIVRVSDGKKFETEVTPVSPKEIHKINMKDGWRFNWKNEYKEAGHHVYKLTLKGETEIQGLISFIVEHDNKCLFLPLIESAPHNFGRSKKFLGVAGNLVAYTCKKSFDLGFEGVVSFKAKTRLISHYEKEFGAQVIFGDQKMAISTSAAKKLVDLYFKP